MQWVEEWQEIPSCSPATARHSTVAPWYQQQHHHPDSQVAVGSGDGSHHCGSYGRCVVRLQVAIVMSGQYHLTIVCTGLDGQSQNNLPLTSTSITLELQT